MPDLTVVLADDHHLVRRGLRALLESEQGIRVVAECADGLAVTGEVERHRPDVLIVDMVMPGLNGAEVARQVTQRSPGTKVILLSMYSDQSYILAALRNGAAGYVLKSVAPEILMDAIRTVMEGRRFLCPPLTERAIEAYIQQAEGGGLDVYDTLTPREKEVLQLAVEGHNNTKIGQMLAISARTVETHRENIMQKLGLRSFAELVRFAVKRGVIPLDP